MRRRQIKEVALREIRIRGRSRGYRFITGIMMVLALAAPIAMVFVPSPTNDLRDVTIGVTPGTPEAFDSQLLGLADGVLDVTVVKLASDDPDNITEQLANGQIDVVLRPPRTLVWDENSDSTTANLIAAALQQVESLRRADELGIDVGELAEVFTPVEVEDEFLNGSSNTEGVRTTVALFGLFLAFLMPQVFGQFTMMSVVEEKSTRVVEVLLSQIRPTTLLAGKIIGLCTLAVAQLAVIIAGLVASLRVTQVVDVPAAVWRFVPMMAVSILGGLVIYTTLFALLGSLISRQEDQAQVMFPVFAPLMAGYFFGQAAIFGNAESLFMRVLTWFPLTSPMLLPVRVAMGAIGPVEVAISLLFLALGSYGLFRLAGRIYEFTLLRTGSRVGWAEAARLSRGSIID